MSGEIFLQNICTVWKHTMKRDPLEARMHKEGQEMDVRISKWLIWIFLSMLDMRKVVVIGKWFDSRKYNSQWNTNETKLILF